MECSPCDAPRVRETDLSGFGFRIGISLAFAGQGMIFGLGYNNALKSGEAPSSFSLVYWALHGGLILSAVLVVFLLGRPLLRQTAEAFINRKITVESLFVLSAFGAFAGSLLSTIRGTGSVYYEVVSIVLCVYAIGKQIGVVHRGRVGQAVNAFRSSFDAAVVEDSNGGRISRPVSKITPLDRVLIQPGDPIPVDATILSGTGYVRETSMTGEPAPVSKSKGDPVLAGTWSLDGNFVLCPNESGERSIDRILEMLETAPLRASRLQIAADRLMQYFVPFVCFVAVGTFSAWIFISREWMDAVFNSMAVLLVACPCALGLAMPAGIWGGLYHLSQRGIIGRSGHVIDSLAGCETIVFDKTGTLTEFELEPDCSAVLPGDPERDTVLGSIAAIGKQSHHPVSRALARVATPSGDVADLHIFPGEGLSANVQNSRFLIGERSLLEKEAILLQEPPDVQGKVIHIAVNDAYAGYVILGERLRPEADASLHALAELGCECMILSGDPAPVFRHIAGITVQYRLSPQDKADCIEKWSSGGKRILFIGDGVNDLLAMQASNAALAIDLGADLTTEFADGLLAEGRVASLPAAIRHCRRLNKALSGNLKFALLYNVIGMTLAAAGVLHPVAAALLMVGSSVVVSFRALRVAGLQG